MGANDFPKTLRIQSQRLREGERLLLVSDGIIQRTNEQGTHFGITGIRKAITRAPSASAAVTLRAIESAAQAHTDEPLTDDATLMVLAPST